MKSRKFAFLVLTLLTSLFILQGCKKYTDTKVDKIKIKQGNNQCLLPGGESKEIIIELLSKTEPGLFGGKGTRNPVPNKEMEFKVAEGSTLNVEAPTNISDNGGNIKFTVKTGKTLGDNYLTVFPKDNPKKSVTLRFINGVRIKGAKQEVTGKKLPEPISIQLIKEVKANDEEVYIKNAPVYFTLVNSPERMKGKIKAKLKKSKVLTNEDGIAETTLTLGKHTGYYDVAVEVDAPSQGIKTRSIIVPEIRVIPKKLFFIVFGGLAIFILGMKLMSDGLQLVAGEKMRSILQWFTRNKWTAVGAGALVTAVIQSSSACTVMVVGFVNAGLLKLTQAIGIVFGANIGTTITAQMISFKLSGLALPAIIIGVIISFFAKKTTTKGWYQAILGFGLLFYGMSIMSAELKLVGEFPFFKEIFSRFDCTPVNGSMPVMSVIGAIAIGTLMTILIQSSSATIGIALALASGGLINFYTAVPLILGDNIGTTITATLAALGANKRAKQAALAHFLFNIIGTIYMILLFYVPYKGQPVFLYFINEITPGDGFIGENITRHIAMAHTMFNVFNVLVLIWFVNKIANLCNKVIKVEEEVEVQHLAPQLLDTPSIALEQTIDSIRYMVRESWKMIDTATTQLFMKETLDETLVEKLEAKEDKIDKLQEDVTNYLVEITRRELSEPQADIIPLLMHCTNDAERIADQAENIVALTKRLVNAKKSISDDAKAEIDDMWEILKDEAQKVIEYFDNIDAGLIQSALKDEKYINKLADKLEKAHVKRLKKGLCNPVCGIIFIEMVSELEKIGDHLTNIAERAPEIQKHHLELN